MDMEYDEFCLPILTVYPKCKVYLEHEWDLDTKYTTFFLEILHEMHPPRRDHF